MTVNLEKYRSKSFHLTTDEIAKLDYLAKHFDRSASKILRNLINKTYKEITEHATRENE